MIKWETDTEKYSNGYLGKVNNYIFFKIYYICGSQGDNRGNKTYQLSCYLPGIKKNLGMYSVEEGKEKAEKVLEFWLDKCGFSIIVKAK